MKILFLTDSHQKGVNPLYRVGSYYEDIKAKFKEAIQISKDMMCDRVLHGGDLFDAPMVSLNLCDELVDMIEQAGIPWYVIRGNHDEIGHNPHLSGASILDHIFRRSKMIQHIGARVADESKVFIEGFDYYHGIEKDLREKGLNCTMGHLDCRKIAVVHAFITKDNFHPDVLHVRCDEIKTDFDLVLLGHYHSEFGIVKVGNTTFVSIGALSRMTVAKSDLERTPNVLFINTSIPSMKIIPLESAKPIEQVFDLKRLQEGKAFEQSIDNFINSLESTKFQGLNLKSIIEKLGQQQNVEREVIDEVISRIERYEVIEK